MFHYKDKLVLVTGASSGLGWHLAQAFAREGAQLALVARRAERLKELVHQIQQKDQKAESFPFDLLKVDEIPKRVNQIEQTMKRPIDVLVHCAGASCYGEIERIPFKAMEQVVTLNYLAGICLVQCVAGPMKTRQSGQIIWIGSGSAFRGIPRAAVYSSSKAAVKNFCEAIRTELKPFHIPVLLVVPGALDTQFHPNQPNYSSDQKIRSTGKPKAPEGLARAIVEYGKREKELLIYSFYTFAGKHLSYWYPSLMDWFFKRRLRGH